MTKRIPCRLLVTAFACAVAAQAQTSPTSGAARGVVRSKKGGPVAGATVSVRNRETGLTRTATTDAKGGYLISFLPVGPYEISATAAGLKTMRQSDLRISLSEAATVNFDLDSVEASATVEIVAEAPLVDVTSVSTNSTINEELIQAIPLNGRNFTDLVQLTPGAAPNTQGYRTTIEGARGIMNNLMIDGTSYNSKFNGEQRGGTRIPFSFGLDSIKELQVITNPFDVQYGDASGGVINAITKGGTNEFSGGAFTQLRPSWGAAKLRPVPYDTTGTNAPSARERNYATSEFGFNVGGPIIKDKLHYFVNVDYVHFTQDSTPIVAPPIVKTPADQTNLDNFNTFWGPTGMGQLVIASNSGLSLLQESRKSWTNAEKHLAAMGRLDWAINEDHRATFRLNVQNYDATNDIYAGTIKNNIAESNNSSINYQSLSWVVELNSVLPHNLLNQALLQLSTERRPEKPNSTVSTSIALPGFTAGNYYIDPRDTDESTTQLIDNLTWITGDWTFKGGIDWQFLHFSNTFFPDGHGEFSFKGWADANAWFTNSVGASNSVTYYQTWSNTNGVVKFDEKLLANYLSAQYAGLLGKRLTLNLGLRYTREMYDENPNPNPKVQGLDHMPDNGSWDPRFGFTLDVFGNNKTLIRGGFGYFSTSNPAQNVASAFLQNGQNMLPYKVVSNSTNLTLFNGPAALIGKDNRYNPANGHITAIDPSLIGPGTDWYQSTPAAIQVTLIDPRARMTHARTAMLGIEHDLGSGYILKARGIQKHFTHLQYFVDINLEQQNPVSGNWDPSIYYNDGYPFRFNHFATSNTSNRPGRATVAGRNLDLSGYGAVGLSRFDGEGTYKALILEFEKRSAQGFGFMSSLTFSSSRDSNSNERNTAQSVASNPMDPTDPLAQGRSDNDIPFRGVLAAYLPRVWGVRASATFTYAKGYPYTPRYYNDMNGDGYFNDPALGGRNSARQPSSKTLNFKLSRTWRLGGPLALDAAMEVYNPFNWANQTTSLTSVDNPNAPGSYGAINVTDKHPREVQFGLRLKF